LICTTVVSGIQENYYNRRQALRPNKQLRER
jgi:hypothetical protein